MAVWIATVCAFVAATASAKFICRGRPCVAPKKEINMKFANYLSMVSIPLVILIIVANGFIEKKKTFDIFVDGAKEGVGIVVNIFPTLIGLFMAISALRVSGILDLIINAISPVLNMLRIPSEIMPLALLRPISRKCVYGSGNRYNENLWSR